MNVRISRALLDRLGAAARAAAPLECCGLLIGDADNIWKAAAVPNIASNPERAFEVDPAAHIAVQRQARKEGLKIVGHYHSHPGGRPDPSAVDAARAEVDGTLWLILTGERAALWVERAGGRVHDRFEPASLIVSDSPPCKEPPDRPIGAE